MGLSETEYDHLYDYAAFRRYPTGSCKNQRRIIRRKCIEHFRAEGGILYYSAVATSKVSEQDRNWKVVVRTEGERKRIIESCHSSPHGKCDIVGGYVYSTPHEVYCLWLSITMDHHH